MSGSIAPILTFGLVALTLAMLAFAIRRLRKETRVTPRALLLGAAVPLATSAAYAIFAGSSWGVAIVVPLAVGIVFGVGLASLSVVQQGPTGPTVRQSGMTMIVWAAVYAATAVISLGANSQLASVTLLALAVTGGMAAGSQLGLLFRTRTVAPAAFTPVPAAVYGTAAAPAQVVAQPPIVSPAPTVVVSPPIVAQAVPEGSRPVAPDPSGPAHYTHSGVRFLLGYTTSASAIWDRATPDRPTAKFPRTTEGRAAAWSQFSALEPAATPVMPYPGLATSPIADMQVEFTHLGSRFAIGRSAFGYGIWDRWAPGAPVATFGTDDGSAMQAWQTFSTWEPQATAL